MGILQMLAASGGGGDLLTLKTATVFAYKVGATASAKFRLASDGGVYYSRTNHSSGAWLWQYNWIGPTSNASLYECTWTAGTGTVDSPPGTAGTYLALTTSRDWGETTAGVEDESASFAARIRKVGEGSDAKTATITLRAWQDA